MLHINPRVICLFLISALILLSCREKYLNPLKDFENKSELKLVPKEVKIISDTILFRPYSIQVFDSLAIFNDNTGIAGFSVINLNSGQLINKFGFSGSEENELDINALSMENGVENYESVFSLTQINPPFKVFRYRWDSILTLSNYKPNPLFYPEDFNFSQSFLLNDSIVFGRFSYSKFDDKTYGLLNLVTNKLSTGIDIPGNVIDKNRSEKDSLYFHYLNNMMYNRVIYRPGSFYEFASFSREGAVMQLINVDENYKIIEKYKKVYYLPTFNLVEGSNFKKLVEGIDNKRGFGNIGATNKNIFVLYKGPLLNNSEENFDKSDVILVYDWDGNPVYSIKLDRKVRLMTVDRKNPHLLYVVSPGSLELIKYLLPE